MANIQAQSRLLAILNLLFFWGHGHGAVACDPVWRHGTYRATRS